MHDPASQLLQSILKFALSLLVPGGGQLFYGRFVLGAAIYALVVGSLALVTRRIVRRLWPRVALVTLAVLGFVAGAIEPISVYYSTLSQPEWPWSVVLPAVVALLTLALVAVIPRPSRRRGGGVGTLA